MKSLGNDYPVPRFCYLVLQLWYGLLLVLLLLLLLRAYDN